MAASQLCRHLKVSLTLARLSSGGPLCSVTGDSMTEEACVRGQEKAPLHWQVRCL